MQLEKLIERAAAIAGSEYKVAKALGIPPQQVCDWKAGRRTCGPYKHANPSLLINRAYCIARVVRLNEEALSTMVPPCACDALTH